MRLFAKLLLLTLVFAARAEPPQWTTALELSLGGDRANVATADVAASGSVVLVVWSDARLGQRRLFMRRSDDFGATWSPESAPLATSAAATEPALASDGRAFYLAWTATDDAARSNVMFSRFDGSTWTPPTQITRDGVSARPRVAASPMFAGRVGVVYESHAQDDARAMFAQSDDAGASWEFALPIARRSNPTRQPDIAASADLFHIVWRDFREPTSHVYYVSRGAGFVGTARRLSQIGGSRAPSVDADGSRVVAAWESQPSIDGPDVFATISENRGQDWERPIALTNSVAQSSRPSARIALDGATVVWQDGREGNFELFFAKNEAGGVWSSPALFAATETASIRARLTTAFPPGRPRNDAADQSQLVWIERAPDGRASVFHSARDTLAPPTPSRPVRVDISANDGWDDDGVLRFRWEPVDAATAYRVTVARNGVAAEEPIGVTAPEIVIEAEDGDKAISARIVAEDAVGNLSESSLSSDDIRIDTVPPVVALIEPRGGDNLFRDAPVRVACRDATLRFCVVEYGVGAAPREWTALADPISESFDSRVVGTLPIEGLNGVVTIRARAEDFAGNETVAAVRVVVDASSPLPVEATTNAPLLERNDLATGRRDAAWSPASNVIAFVTDEGGTLDIWTTRADGSETTQVTRDAFPDSKPTWHPSGDMIAYSSLRGAAWDIVVRANDDVELPLVVSPNADRDPAWSHDGQRLAFASDRDGDFEIYILENVEEALNGGEPILSQITRNNEADRRPDWGPSDGEIAFESTRSGDWSVWAARSDGGEPRRLLTGVAEDRRPVFDRSGKRILFTRVLNAAASLRVFDLVSGDVRSVTPSDIDARYGVWSPDGKAIVFESQGDLLLSQLTYPQTELDARISAPPDGALVNEMVNVTGVARGDQMASYRLEYAPTADPIMWKPITGTATSPVTGDGFLGQWDTRGLNGSYRLRLVVQADDGTTRTDESVVTVRESTPQLDLLEPGNGAQTLERSVRVAGVAEPGGLLTINDERAALAEDGTFDAAYPLNEGENALEVVVRDDLGGETRVERTVTRVTAPFELGVASPTDFQIVAAPFVRVIGSAPGARVVRVNGVETPLSDADEFTRVVAVSTEGTTIEIRATDALDRDAVERRWVAFDPLLTNVGPDNAPPEIVEPSPPFGAVVATREVTFTAFIADDRVFDADSLMLAFDGEQLEPEDWEFDAETGWLTYAPEFDLTDGAHILRIEGRDRAGNALASGEWPVVVDTEPLVARLAVFPSADRASGTAALTSTREIGAVWRGQAWIAGQKIGVPLSFTPIESDEQKRALLESLAGSSGLMRELAERASTDAAPLPFVYEATFALRGASAAAAAADIRARSGVATTAVGEFATGVLSTERRLTLRLSDESEATFETHQRNDSSVVFRTHGGLDAAQTDSQRQDADDRGLTITGGRQAIYAVESMDADALPPFELSTPLDARDPRAWFRWDSAGQRWRPMPDQRMTQTRLTAVADGAGVYGLMGDAVPPELVESTLLNQERLPSDRHFIQAVFIDDGSGVSTNVEARIDGAPTAAEIVAGENEAVARYVPTNLRPGLHELTLTVFDRAGNAAKESFEFFSEERFALTAFRLQPNPIRNGEGRVLFQLTRTADVTLDIYTADGVKVYSAALIDAVGDAFSQERGGQSFRWNLTNDSGRSVASGVYVVQLTARSSEDGTVRATAKWAVIR